ncbi:hypothetical protein Tco_1473771 [Tanacetum coccineum]
MDDNRTMAQLLEAPTEGYEDAIVVPEINANNFEIKHGLLNLVKTRAIFLDHDIRSPKCPTSIFQQDHFYDEVPKRPDIESKSKVRQSRSKAIVSKVSTSSSTPAVSSDVAELKDMVRAIDLSIEKQTPAPAPVKAVELSCVTCGGGHSYQNCPATDGSIYRDNIQEYVSQARLQFKLNQGNAMLKT